MQQVSRPISSHPIQKLIVKTQQQQRIDKMVENRTVYGSEQAELNIYETFEKASLVELQFNHSVVVGMIEGKKVMHFQGQQPLDFLPNETMVLPPRQAMKIDFPEASDQQPTRCLALLISDELISETVAEHFEELNKYENWDRSTEPENHSILRSPHITQNIHRLVQLFLENNQFAKPTFIDFSLKELIIRILQTEAKHFLLDPCAKDDPKHRFTEVARYIHKNLHREILPEQLCHIAGMSQASFYRYFKEAFGESPNTYISKEKIKFAKKLLAKPHCNITEVCYELGFNSLHYFDRVFKKITGITPTQYKERILRNSSK